MEQTVTVIRDEGGGAGALFGERQFDRVQQHLSAMTRDGWMLVSTLTNAHTTRNHDVLAALARDHTYSRMRGSTVASSSNRVGQPRRSQVMRPSSRRVPSIMPEIRRKCSGAPSCRSLS